MQIHAIRSIQFKGAETDNKDKSSAENKKDTAAKNSPYAYYSKAVAYEAQKLSVGREKEDGEYKAATIIAGLGAVAASLMALFKSIKSLNLNKKLNKAIKNSASSERIAELKTAALKKQKGSTVALGIGLALTFVSIGAWAKNKFEADKTAKERGFMPDKELNQKAVQDKSTIDKTLDALKTKDAETKDTETKDTETKEQTKEDIKETAENNN